MKTEGRNQRLSTEATSANSVLRNVLATHQDEVRADNNLAKAVLMVLFENASLSDLRHLAAKGRKKKRDHGLAYFFEMCADNRERAAI